MALTTSDRAVVGVNLVNPDTVDTISHSGFTENPAFGADNIGYADPWTMVKGTSASSPMLETRFTSSQTCSFLGIVNHNLYSAGWTTIEVFYGTGPTSMGTFGITSDNDVMIRFDQVGTTRFRIELSPGGGDDDFFIGSVLWGPAQELTMNPLDALFTFSQSTNVRTVRSQGGALHVMKPYHARRNFSLEAVFERMNSAQAEFFSQIADGDLVGFQPPEQVDTYGAYGTPHFFGYVQNIDTAPRSYNTTKWYDGIISMTGGV